MYRHYSIYYTDQTGTKYIGEEASRNIMKLIRASSSPENNIDNYVFNFGTLIKLHNSNSAPNYSNNPQDNNYVLNYIYNLSNLPSIIFKGNVNYYLCQTSYHYDQANNILYEIGVYNNIESLNTDYHSSPSIGSRGFVRVYRTTSTGKTFTDFPSTYHGLFVVGISQKVVNNTLLYHARDSLGRSRIISINLNSNTITTLLTNQTVIGNHSYKNYSATSNNYSTSLYFINHNRTIQIFLLGNGRVDLISALYGNVNNTYTLIGQSSFSNVNWVYIDSNFNLYFSYNNNSQYYLYPHDDYTNLNPQTVGNITQNSRRYAIHGGSNVYYDRGGYINETINNNTLSYPLKVNARIKTLIKEYNAYNYRISHNLYYVPPELFNNSNSYSRSFVLPNDIEDFGIYYNYKTLTTNSIYFSESNTNNKYIINSDTRFLIVYNDINNNQLSSCRISNYVANSLYATNCRVIIPIAYVRRANQYGYDTIYVLGYRNDRLMIFSSNDCYTNSYNILFDVNINDPSYYIGDYDLYSYHLLKSSNNNCHYLNIVFFSNNYFTQYLFCVKGIRYGTGIRIRLPSNLSNRIVGTYVEEYQSHDRLYADGYWINDGNFSFSSYTNPNYVSSVYDTKEFIRNTCVKASPVLYVPLGTKQPNNHYCSYFDVRYGRAYQHYTNNNNLNVYSYHVISNMSNEVYEMMRNAYVIHNNPNEGINEYGFSFIGYDSVGLFRGLGRVKAEYEIRSIII